MGRDLDTENEHSIIALAYASYGWMPTILKSLPDSNQAALLGKLVTTLRSSKIDEVVSSLCENHELLQSINGSVVGMSKFLHFCVPEKIPIWDSRIGKIFGCRGPYQVNNIKNFLSYVKIMVAFDGRGTMELPASLDKVLAETAPPGVMISNLRKLELCLFLQGGLTKN
jgi:hypothetical protein